MHLISQENSCVGMPEACSWPTIKVSHSPVMNNVSDDAVSSSILEQRRSVPEVTSIAQLSASASKQYEFF